jgi:flagellum-specific ATP synthase
MGDVMPKEHIKRAQQFLETLAVYRRSEDLINIGAYAVGSNTKIDHAIKMIDGFNMYLRQDFDEKVSLADSSAGLKSLIN